MTNEKKNSYIRLLHELYCELADGWLQEHPEDKTKRSLEAFQNVKDLFKEIENEL